MNRAFIVIGLLFLLPGVTWGQGSVDARCTQPKEQACVDWNNGLAIAIGTGAPASWARSAAQKNISATRAARLDAARNLLELLKGISLTGSSSVENAMVASDSVSTSIQGRLHGIRPVERPRYFSDGSVQVKLEAQLRQVIPENLYLDNQGPPRELGAPTGASGTSALNTGGAFSGLIVDARGTGVKPAMSPKIFDQQGREIYGSAFVSREFAVSQGMVGYVKSIEAARKTDRVQGNPAVVKALEAKGANKADLVVSQSDADALRKITQGQNFLREARVMIVLD